MKRWLLYLFVLAASFLGRAQSSGIDSLKRELIRSKSEPQKVVLMSQLSNDYAFNKQLDSCFWYANQAMALAKRIGFKGGEAEAWYALGRCYRALGDTKNRLTCHRTAVAICERYNYFGETRNETNFRIRLLSDLAGHYPQTNADSAHYFRKKLYTAARQSGIPRAQAASMVTLGLSYFDSGDYSTALRLYFRALPLAESIGDTNSVSEIYRSIGFLYAYADEDQKAKPYLLKALSYKKVSKIGSTQRYIYGHLSEVYEGLNQLDSALYCGEKAYQLGVQEKDLREMGYYLYTQAKAHERMGHTARALNLYGQGMATCVEQTNPRTLAYIQQELAKLYLKLGKTDSSVYYARQSYALFRTIRSPFGIVRASAILTDAYKAQNRIDSAFKYQEIMLATKESLIGRQQVQQIQLLNFEEQQRQEKNRLEQENRQKSLQWIGLLAVLVMLTFAAFMLYRNRMLARQNANLQAAVLQGQTTERQRVAADLHDNLGTTLSALQWNLEAMDPTQLTSAEQTVYATIRQQVSQAYKDVRLLSHNLLPDELAKQGLAVALQTLVNKLNRNTAVRFSLSGQDRLPRLDARTEFELYSICLELLNNILKHARATEAQIGINLLDGVITLTIGDNGVGLSDQRTEGRGLQSVAARVEALGGTWQVESGEKPGVENRVTVPVRMLDRVSK